MSSITEIPKRLRYEEIAGDLQEQITKGLLQPEDRLPPVRTLMREYSTTQAIVERALGLLEKEALIVRSSRSGVYVARPDQKPATGIIGFYGVSFTQTNFSAYWTHLLEGVEAALRERELQLLLLNSLAPAGWSSVDGILINSAVKKIPASLLPAHIPVVSFFVPPTLRGNSRQKTQAAQNVSLIAPDDYSGARQATMHLLRSGHRRIAWLNNSNNDRFSSARRLAGYRDALQEHGVKWDPNWVRALPSPSPQLYFMNAARDTMRQWIAEDWSALGCTALLAQNDDTAWGAAEAFREAGIAVPDDVSVVGYDGTEVADCCNPRLTTIEVPLQELGRRGVEILWQRLQGRLVEKEVLMPVKLRMGESTRRL